MSEARIENLERAVGKIDNKIDNITEALQSLVRIEERQISTTEKLNTGAGKMQDHETRIRNIEKEIPGLVESRKWVVLGVISGIAMIGAAIFKVVLVS